VGALTGFTDAVFFDGAPGFGPNAIGAVGLASMTAWSVFIAGSTDRSAVATARRGFASFAASFERVGAAA